MDNFNYEKKENYTQEDMDRILEQNSKYMTKSLKTDFDNKEKEYTAKINTYEDEKLFSSIKDEKNKTFIKDLMQVDKYKSLPKEEAFKKINEDYAIFLTPKENEENKNNSNQHDISKTILDLHNGTDDPTTLDKLKLKAQTVGTTDKEELKKLISIAKAEAHKKIK